MASGAVRREGREMSECAVEWDEPDKGVLPECAGTKPQGAADWETQGWQLSPRRPFFPSRGIPGGGGVTGQVALQLRPGATTIYIIFGRGRPPEAQVLIYDGKTASSAGSQGDCSPEPGIQGGYPLLSEAHPLPFHAIPFCR